MNRENTETVSQKSICQFIKDSHTSGALLVTGEWGSGKTYFLKQLAEKCNKTEYAVIHISLFGRNSSEEIEHDIKKELCYIFATADITGHNSRDENSKRPKFKMLRKRLNQKDNVSKFVKGLRMFTDHFKDESKIVGGIDSLLNFNYWDFIDLDSVIFGKRIVIIFDDFERCTIDSDLLLGVINEYSENLKIKVIIVANDEHINKSKKFLEYKEKVVYKTVKLEQNIENVLKALIHEFDTRSSEYQRYLEDHFREIIQVFNTSTYNNFRSLRTAINDFEKIYSLFVKKTQFQACHKFEDFEDSALSFLLEQFFAFIMEASAGKDIHSFFFDMYTNPIGENEDGSTETLEYTSETIPEYVSKYAHEVFDIYSAPKAIVEWVAKGIFNEEAIDKCIEAYIEKYKPHVSTDMELFLTTQILFFDSIDQFNNGYIEALNNSYTGALKSEQYLSLLCQIREAKQLGIVLPENPQYDIMTKGFESVDRTNEEEPVLGGFSGWADEAALELKKEIEASIRNRNVNKRTKEYYNYCLGFFRSCNTNDFIHFRFSDRIQLELNDEMIETVVEAFKTSKNKKRREIASCFLHIQFSNYKDSMLTNKLIQKLSALKVNDIVDPLGIANLEYFIEEAKQRFLLSQN